MENKRNRVLLCLGSNWDKEKNMERAAEMLRAHFGFYTVFSASLYGTDRLSIINYIFESSGCFV